MTTTNRTPLEQLRNYAMDRMDGHKKLTDERRIDIIQRAQEIQVAEDISNRVMGRIISCSPAVWSQICSGKYRGDTDKYLLAADEWLAGRMRPEAPLSEYVETFIGRQVHAVCARAHQMPCIGLVVCRSGTGKTAALRAYAAGQDRRRCIYIQAGECFSTKASLIAVLREQLDVSRAAKVGRVGSYHRVRHHLAGLYSGGRAAPALIIVDEATTLQASAINMLRNLHDDPACRAGLVLADTWRLDGEIKSRGGMTGGYEQLRSRCGAQYLMDARAEVSKKDVTAVTGSILESLGRKRKLAAAAYTYLHRLAQGDGALRNVLHRLHAVHDLALSQGIVPAYSVAELDYVASMVGGRCELPSSATVCPFTAPPQKQARRTA